MPLRPDIATELLLREVNDRTVRRLQGPQPTTCELHVISVVDHDNTEALKRIIAEHGWPGCSLVGEEAARAAWLLAQHADADVEFQQRALGLLAEAVRRREAEPRQFAYLSDRLQLHAGLPQFFGTQYVYGEQGVVMHPVADPERLDERRAAVGLPPQAEYDVLIRVMYEPYGGEAPLARSA